MSVDAVSIKKKVLEERYKALEADFIIVNRQITQTQNAAERQNLKRQADDLFNQMTEVEDQLKPLKSSVITYDTHYKNWEENLPKINFSQASIIFNYIFENEFEEQGGAVFFLLQNCRPMGGKWCVEKIKASLKDKGVWSPREIAFLSWEQPNPSDFLNRLGTCLGLEVIADSLEQSTKMIIDEIYNSLQIDSTVFVEVKIISIDNQTTFLEWLINKFWISLISRLPQASNNLPFVKFIIVLTVATTIPRDCLSSDIFCEKGKFNPKKMIELELGNWTEVEIKNWLLRFSGLGSPTVGRKRQEIEKMARIIYQESQGRPIDVHSFLMDELTMVLAKS